MPLNLALKILKEIYTQGDGYYESETDNEWSASFSNDYPLQHGNGWTLKISKNTYSFTVSKAAKHYRPDIEKLIEKYK
jgi:hypothetical protein